MPVAHLGLLDLPNVVAVLAHVDEVVHDGNVPLWRPFFILIRVELVIGVVEGLGRPFGWLMARNKSGEPVSIETFMLE